jgi:hypothetical protein
MSCYIRRYCLMILGLISPLSSFAINQKFSYFGYYWGMNDINSISSNVNTMFISNQYNATDINYLAQKDINGLLTLNNHGIRGIIDISSVFFDLSQTDSSGHFLLRVDWESRFNTYWRSIYPYLGLIRAFYPMDEPDMNLNLSDYAKATHILKINIDTTQFKIPILMVITASGVIKLKNNSLFVPHEISWLGFDEYGCWGNECYGGISIPQKLNILNDFISLRGGNVVVVGDGAFMGAVTPTYNQQMTLVNRNMNYVSLCNSTTNCVGMFVFLWETVLPLGLIGVSSMPTLQNYLNGI